jgi:hypothetical protein
MTVGGPQIEQSPDCAGASITKAIPMKEYSLTTTDG